MATFETAIHPRTKVDLPLDFHATCIPPLWFNSSLAIRADHFEHASFLTTRRRNRAHPGWLKYNCPKGHAFGNLRDGRDVDVVFLLTNRLGNQIEYSAFKGVVTIDHGLAKSKLSLVLGMDFIEMGGVDIDGRKRLATFRGP